MFASSVRISFVVLLLFITSTAEARWATFEEAALKTKFATIDIDVNADGTINETVVVHMQILKEEGRAKAAGYQIFYTEQKDQLKILEAKTIYQGKEYKLTAEMIEDKPMASSQHGFDQQRQILLSFPHAEVGAEIYLKYTCNSKPELDNFFSEVYMYGMNKYVDKLKLNLRSKIPLFLEVNDPNQVFDIKKDKDSAFHNLTVTLKKPLWQKTVYEPENVEFDDKHFAWIAVSSLTDWHDFARQVSPKYEKVINQPLPELFKSILQEARKVNNEIDQINTVTSLLNEKIKYMGDWRSIEGKYFPRDLAKIAAMRVADCKEFSVATAAILKGLGFKVQTALVYRGGVEVSKKTTLPYVGSFNHAFLKVTNKQGKVYWIDPTNDISMAQGMFEDVADKYVLILDSDHPSYERSAAIDPKHSQLILHDTLTINDAYVHHSGSISLGGEEAQDFYTQGLYQSSREIRDQLFHFLTGESLAESDKEELIFPKLGARVVADIKASFKYKQRNQVLKTNLMPAIVIRYNWFLPIINYNPNQIGDLIIDSPYSLKRYTIIADKKLKSIDKLNYQLSTPWLDVQRNCYYENNSTVIADEVIIKKQFIKSEELIGKEYQALRREIIQNYQNMAIILEE